MKILSCCFDVLVVLVLLILTPLHAQGSGEVSPSPSELFSPGKPITDAGVEAGLRQTRESLRNSPTFSKRDAPTHLQLAKFLSQQGDPNGAIEEYRAALQLDPYLAEAHRGLGAVYLDKHEWKLAQDSLQTSADLDPLDGQTFYWLGRAFLAQHQYSSATDAFIKATQLNPGDAYTFSDLGLGFMAQGLPREASKALTQAIRLQPDLAEAHHRLEQLHLANGNPQHLAQSARANLYRLFGQGSVE